MNFSWPIERPDFATIIKKLANGDQDAVPHDMKPINPFSESFIIENNCKNESIDMVVLVKSAVIHFENRQVIRNTWGRNLSHMFFLLADCDPTDHKCSSRVKEESSLFNDLIMVDFVDQYYSLTRKAIAGLHWIMNFCSAAKYGFFVDDDQYVNVNNVKIFLSDPYHDPFNIRLRNQEDRHLPRLTQDVDDRLYAGWVGVNWKPFRTKNKHYISIKDYPFDRWPDFVIGRGYLLSMPAIKEMSLATQFVKTIPFDDYYFSIVRLKLGIRLIHSSRFTRRTKYKGQNLSKIAVFDCWGNITCINKVWNDWH